MNETLLLLMRFLHLTGAAIGLGGLLIAAVVLPKLGEDARAIASRQIGKWIGIGLTVAVAAGIVNMLHAMQVHSDPAYIKILMAKATLGILVFLASIIVFHPAKAFQPFADRRPMWAGILLLAGLLVVLLGNKLHTYSMPTDPKGGMPLVSVGGN